ncbi:MAG TPA: hypothetical protein VMW04_04755 [Patescibacteria group bacterium]|nr:hypothetical protein [Patescibacteria group bacterium]
MEERQEKRTDQDIRREIDQKIKSLKEAIAKKERIIVVVEISDPRVAEIFREVTAGELGVDWENPGSVLRKPVMNALYEGEAEELTRTEYGTTMPGVKVTHNKFEPLVEGYRPRENFAISFKDPDS